MLQELIEKPGMPIATKRVCNTISTNEEEKDIRRGPWTLEEDSLLIHHIACHGEGRWNVLAKCAGLKRTGKSCRLRWLNYLKPDIKRGNLSPKEQLLILELHAKWGNRWSKIAQHLPGRTDNQIKNYWRTRVQKQARQLNIESGSKKFLDTVRCFWMPRLLQKMEQNSPPPPYSSINPSEPSTLASPLVPPLPPSSPTPSPFIDSTNHSNGSSTSLPNPSNPSSYSMNISQLLEISEHPTSPYVFGKNPLYGYDDADSFDMVGLSLESISSTDNNGFSQLDCYVADNDWVMDDMSDTLWNM